MNFTTNIVVDRIQRILKTGEIIAVNRAKIFVMADEIIDPTNITGQHIPVWGNVRKYYAYFYYIHVKFSKLLYNMT